MQFLFRAAKWIQYRCKAKTKYYLHSPFVYKFYLHVLQGNENRETKAILQLRKKLRSNHSEVAVTDFGSGYRKQQKISTLESKVALPHKHGQVLLRLINFYGIKSALELGTSIGLSSSYLAAANPNVQITSLDGDDKLHGIAKINHEELGLKNMRLITGEFDATLSGAFQNIVSPTLFFFDGNHRKEPTLRYFNLCLEAAKEDCILVFDDIYWSKEMSETWEIIKQHPRITLSIDIFQLGICFCRKGKLAKEHFVLQY